jgi:hypothetical protein
MRTHFDREQIVRLKEQAKRAIAGQRSQIKALLALGAVYR